jgi:hypothetical protein
MTDTISEVTRRASLIAFATSESAWARHLSEEEFLSRLYDLTKSPCTDLRFQNAASEIRHYSLNENVNPLTPAITE